MLYHKHKSTSTRHTIFHSPRKEKSVPVQNRLLLSKAIEGFLLACRARKLSAHTLTDYSRTLKRFLAHVGDAQVKDITSAQVSAFLAAQDFSAKTVLNYHIGLAALWTWLIRDGYTDRHIVRQVEKPRPQEIVIQPFTEVEMRALMSGIRRNVDRDRVILMILLDTGIRASELCNVELGDIDLVARHIKVLGKGNKERLLPFSPRTASAVFRYVTNLEGGKPFPFTRTSLAHLVRKIGDRSGVKDVHPHRFRHTFAIQFLRNGGDVFALQRILGHTTMETVRLYLALAQVDMDAAHKLASPVDNWKI